MISNRLDRNPLPVRPTRPAPQAFTLIEVLLAVTLFALVLAAAHSVLFGALRLRSRTTAAVDRSLELERALDRIRQDLAHLAMPGTLAGELQTSLIAQDTDDEKADENERPEPGTTGLRGQSSPDFYTTTGALDPYLPWGDIQRVTYQLLAPTNRTSRGKDLVRLVVRNLLPSNVEDAPEEQWLLGDMQSLLFEYYNGSQWVETWDSTTETNKLPAAIRVSLQRLPLDEAQELPAPIQLVVPVWLQAATNTTATNSTSSSTGGAS